MYLVFNLSLFSFFAYNYVFRGVVGFFLIVLYLSGFFLLATVAFLWTNTEVAGMEWTKFHSFLSLVYINSV